MYVYTYIHKYVGYIPAHTHIHINAYMFREPYKLDEELLKSVRNVVQKKPSFPDGLQL